MKNTYYAQYLAAHRQVQQAIGHMTSLLESGGYQQAFEASMDKFNKDLDAGVDEDDAADKCWAMGAVETIEDYLDTELN